MARYGVIEELAPFPFHVQHACTMGSCTLLVIHSLLRMTVTRGKHNCIQDDRVYTVYTWRFHAIYELSDCKATMKFVECKEIAQYLPRH